MEYGYSRAVTLASGEPVDGTMRLAEFIASEKEDPNLFWRLASGDHQNLLDEAIDTIERLRAALEEIADYSNTSPEGSQCAFIACTALGIDDE